VLGVDADGVVVLADAAAGRMFGRPVADVLGAPVESLVAADRFGWERLLRDAARAAPPVDGGTATLLRSDATTLPAELRLAAVLDRDGAVIVLVGIRDTTPRAGAEIGRKRRVLEVQRLESLGQLAGGVAHDFNNLLGVILNYTTLVSRRVDDPVARGDLDEIRSAAERGASLTRQLLTFARRDTARPEKLDVTAAVRHVASMLNRTLGEHIELDLELTGEPLVVVCDRTQLEQILLNLAINARDAMSDGGVLVISAAAEPPSAPGEPPGVVLSVSDTGHGMPAEVADRAFEPFFTTKPRGRGTGLGLATVYGIVEQNHGSVDIETAPEEGTTVTVWLPRADSADTVLAPAGDMPHGTGERVLLVEDKDALRIVTARLLSDNGYEVLVAEDGLAALDVLDRERDRVDVVLTDIAMPRMRGDELAEAISDRAPHLPVLFMTGYDSGVTPKRSPVLTKPVSEHDLLQALREVLDD
jgi:hypothetical protein